MLLSTDSAFSITPSGGTKPPLLFRGSASGSSSGVPRLPSVSSRPGSRGRQVDQPSQHAESTPGALSKGYGSPSEPSAMERQKSGESEAIQEKLEQLEATNARLRARCERQEKTLVEMGKQLKVLRSGQPNPTELKPKPELDQVEAEAKSSKLSPSPACKSSLVDCGSQTEDDLMERIQIQQEQLDSLYDSAGAKSREVYHLQDTVRNLQKDVQAHQCLSEQFRDQVSEIEARLAEEIQLMRRAEEERTILEWQLRTAKSVKSSGSKKGKSSADRSTACPSTPGSQLHTQPTSLQSTHTGLPKLERCNHRNNRTTDVSAAAARGAARMAQWSANSDDELEDEESSTSQILETSIGVSDEEN